MSVQTDPLFSNVTVYFLSFLGHYIPIVQQGSSPGVWFVTFASVMPVGLIVIAKGSIKESPVIPGDWGFVGGVWVNDVLSG